MGALGHAVAIPFRRSQIVIACAYPLDADATEVGDAGFAPLTLSGGDQTCTYTIDGAPSGNVQAAAFQSGAGVGASSTLNLVSGKKVVQFVTTMPATVGGGGATAAYQVEHTIATTAFSTIALVKFQLDADGDKEITVYLGASLVLTTTPAVFPSVIDMRFDCGAGTAAVAFDGVEQALSSYTFTPAQAIAVVAVYEKTDSPAGDAGKTIAVSLRTAAAEIAGYQPSGYTDACDIQFGYYGIYPTAFSATQRGGYAGADFGTYADGGMRVVRHDATTAWLSIRTISGIASGSRVSCWATVTGTSNAVGIGLGNASVALSNYAGADANGINLFGDTADVYSGGASVETTTGTLAQNDRVRMDVNRVGNTVRFYKQTGGTGAYVAMCDPVDISGLGSGLLYPVCSTEDANAVVTWDFGHGTEVAPSGYTAGPRGPYGGWLLPHVELYFGNDTTRMWESSGSPGVSAPDVVSGDPIGGWHGVNYARLLSQSGSSARPQKNATGVLFDASGGLKTISHALASAIPATDPFTVFVRLDNVSANAPRVGYGSSATVLSSGHNAATTTKQRAVIRTANTEAAADFAGSVRTMVVTYDGTNAYMLDADGNWSSVGVGTGVLDMTHILIRAIATDASVSTVRVFQIANDAVTETEARNWQYWAVNNLDGATA